MFLLLACCGRNCIYTTSNGGRATDASNVYQRPFTV